MPFEKLSAEEFIHRMKRLGSGRNRPEASSRTKYGNTVCEYDGHRFDSIKEMQRYAELKLLERAGLIEGLELQPFFLLLKKPRRVYIADFSYKENGIRIVEDVKSSATKKNPVYTLKRDLFLDLYGDKLEFREID